MACESLHFVPRAAAEAMAGRVEAPGGARELERPLEREPAGEAGGEAGGEGVSRTAGIRRLDLGCGHADETVFEHSERRLFGPRAHHARLAARAQPAHALDQHPDVV